MTSINISNAVLPSFLLHKLKTVDFQLALKPTADNIFLNIISAYIQISLKSSNINRRHHNTGPVRLYQKELSQ